MAKIPIETDPTMKEKRDSDESKSSDKSSLARLPEKFEHSVNPVLLRTLSSSPLHNMSRNPSDASSVGRVRLNETFDNPSFQATDANTIPRRNLTSAFEELYTKPNTNVDTPVVKQAVRKDNFSNVISPTGVAEFGNEIPHDSLDPTGENASEVACNKEEMNTFLPHFVLHEDLKLELSDALVDRVSFYAIIHDINKEATTMASNDDSGYNRNPEDLKEEYDPLIVAVNGYPKNPLALSSSMVNVALIDEEKWLLDTIESRSDDESRAIKACPPTFLQAMGERDYENPLASLSSGSRTQLWKPSRSWWEAKSGKNPWIEPTSHNKRWRYLWPLIHYHKFLAKCIKKLKRNGVDVKTSVSPVSVFLREEVCAVSDHLAAVSLFDSDQWMSCLEHFSGWTDTSSRADENMRALVSQLHLRPLAEPGDVDSPLLRSQIDEQYLRAMASARAQLAGTSSENERQPNKDPANKHIHQTPEPMTKRNSRPQTSLGPPPTYPRQNVASPNHNGSSRNGPSPSSLRRPRLSYPPHHSHWYGGWHPHAVYHFGDDNSVQSGLSGDSYPHPYDMSMYPAVMHHPQYYHAMMYAHHYPSPMHPDVYDPAMHEASYNTEGSSIHNYDDLPWSSQTQAATNPDPAVTPSKASSGQNVDVCPSAPYPSNPYYVDPATPAAQTAGEHTPYKYNAVSPYWGHLDHTTLAMMGIATPQGVPSPQTASLGIPPSPARPETAGGEETNVAPVNAQPLLLRPPYPSYGFYGTREGYGPPSPATQFMMSPQANFGYGYTAYSGFSPSRMASPSHPSNATHDCIRVAADADNSTDPVSVAPSSKTEVDKVSDIREASTGME